MFVQYWYFFHEHVLLDIIEDTFYISSALNQIYRNIFFIGFWYDMQTMTKNVILASEFILIIVYLVVSSISYYKNIINQIYD